MLVNVRWLDNEEELQEDSFNFLREVEIFGGPEFMERVLFLQHRHDGRLIILGTERIISIFPS